MELRQRPKRMLPAQNGFVLTEYALPSSSFGTLAFDTTAVSQGSQNFTLRTAPLPPRGPLVR